MGRRKNWVRLETKEVQGEGSYVILSLPTVDEVQDIIAQAEKEGKNLEAFQKSADVLGQHIKEWDWVDDNDVPFPLPKDEPKIVGQLTSKEFKILIDALFGNEEKRKN